MTVAASPPPSCLTTHTRAAEGAASATVHTISHIILQRAMAIPFPAVKSADSGSPARIPRAGTALVSWRIFPATALIPCRRQFFGMKNRFGPIPEPLAARDAFSPRYIRKKDDYPPLMPQYRRGGYNRYPPHASGNFSRGKDGYTEMTGKSPFSISGTACARVPRKRETGFQYIQNILFCQ